MNEILAPGLPEHPVIDTHLIAYQDRNLERFVSCFADEIRGSRNGQHNLNGVEQLRNIYECLFSASPNLRVRISARRIEGEYVYDTEHVLGWRGSDKEITAHVRYRILAGKIADMDICLVS